MQNNKTILIAEDEIAMLDALVKKFSLAGFEVLKAPDGEEAVNLAFKKKPDFIMLDIIMPKLDGLDVVKKIRADEKWGSEVPIIMLTNLSDAQHVSEAARYQVYDFLVKTDWRLEDVVQLVKNKLGLKL